MLASCMAMTMLMWFSVMSMQATLASMKAAVYTANRQAFIIQVDSLADQIAHTRFGFPIDIDGWLQQTKQLSHTLRLKIHRIDAGYLIHACWHANKMMCCHVKIVPKPGDRLS